MTGAIHVARAARQHQATIDALAVPASDLSWKFAFEDAIEAGMRVAVRFEDASDGRRLPTFVPTAEAAR